MADTSRRDFVKTAGLTATTMAAGSAPMIASTPPAPPHRFSLGIVTYNIARNWNRQTIINVCRNVGIASVEFRTTHQHGIETTLNQQQRTEVRNAFRDANIEIWGCGTTCEFHANNQQEVQRNIEQCREFIQLVADIGGKGVKVRPNRLVDGVNPQQTLNQIGDALRICGAAAAQANVEIWVEVHGPGTSLPTNMRTIMQRCNHPNVGVCWNSNPTDVENGSIQNSFAMLRPWIKSVHIHDLYDNYPYAQLFRLLREMNYDRTTLAEIQGTPDVPSGERLLRYYKAVWDSLSGQ